MGKIRVAKDGHLYERRCTYGGQFYTVQHGGRPIPVSWSGPPVRIWPRALVIGLVFAPFTKGISIAIALAASQVANTITGND
jgi:hypothetical protein